MALVVKLDPKQYFKTLIDEIKNLGDGNSFPFVYLILEQLHLKLMKCNLQIIKTTKITFCLLPFSHQVSVRYHLI